MSLVVVGKLAGKLDLNCPVPVKDEATLPLAVRCRSFDKDSAKMGLAQGHGSRMPFVARTQERNIIRRVREDRFHCRFGAP